MDCIFCKIAAGEMPSDKVYEDDRVFAFRDLHPQAPTHILIIPKRHISSLDSLTPGDESLAGHILVTAPKIARDAGLTEGWRLISNCGKHGGQSVFHLHFHLLGGKPLPLTMG